MNLLYAKQSEHPEVLWLQLLHQVPTIPPEFVEEQAQQHHGMVRRLLPTIVIARLLSQRPRLCDAGRSFCSAVSGAERKINVVSSYQDGNQRTNAGPPTSFERLRLVPSQRKGSMSDSLSPSPVTKKEKAVGHWLRQNPTMELSRDNVPEREAPSR